MSSGGIAFDPLVQNKLWQSAGTGVWHNELGPWEPYPVWHSQSTGIEQLVATDIIVPPGGVPIVASWDRPFFTIDNLGAFP